MPVKGSYAPNLKDWSRRLCARTGRSCWQSFHPQATPTQGFERGVLAASAARAAES